MTKKTFQNSRCCRCKAEAVEGSFSLSSNICSACLKEKNRLAYAKHRDKRLDSAKANYATNKEHKKEYQKKYYRSTLEYQKVWHKQNKTNKRYKYNAYEAKRRATKLNATPSWLTEEQLLQIEYVYWLAKDVSKITGEEYQVDHIIPLQGVDVCGLHVPWNLQLLPAKENAAKKNKKLDTDT